MPLDADLIFGFFLVFVRASAMLISSPVFGAQHTPANIRVMTTLSIAAALTLALKPHLPSAPQDLITFVGAIANEAVAGLLLGTFVSFVFLAIQMAGSFLDFQIGLGSSQIMNPITGVPVTIVAQMKFLLAVAIFLAMNGHHAMFRAFVLSYDAIPAISIASLGALQGHVVTMIGAMSLLALQISAPVAAVSIIIDVGLGLINKAVPQMPVMVVGMPAKLMAGILGLGVILPALVSGVDSGVNHALDSLWNVWKAG